ncbi:MBL fold hydrolase [Halopseudomonas aestusnigri]|uniref:MBL fold metallo-hydrolase n=1 Tax=Halopseudomonas TaxID=2901189 RepID=UPI0022B5F261|nr:MULTISPECIES: MBL fold metallo-hydrolase [Halopseudomonas]BDX20541.1 MBL fold hydrolase [Halopseudomonas aestusnigri]
MNQHPYPRVQHHGAVNGVTGSCHQLWMTPTDSLLIDCGLFQGAETSGAGAGQDQLAIEFPLDSVHALLLTHVHVDHVGRLPWLLAAGFDQAVHATDASALLLPAVLEDAFRVGVRPDAALASRYVAAVSALLQGHAYGQWVSLITRDDLICRIRFQPAGHILGSAYVEIDIDYPPEQRSQRVVFSGDLGAAGAPLLEPPQPPERADLLILESTYGDRLHEDRATRRARLQRVLEQALADGGTVIVPAFSIGRTQELLYELEGIMHDNPEWQQIPVILDAPLAGRFTALYRELRQSWNAEGQARLAAGRRPLGFDQLLKVQTHAQHQRMLNRLVNTRRPAVVITGSGMCNAGRVVNYLKAMLGDIRHNVVFVGYQAKGTPGHAIQQYGPAGGYVELDGQRYTIRAGVHSLGGYSAHADQAGLIAFVRDIPVAPREVRLVHGDAAAKAELAAQLRADAKAQDRSLNVVIAD